MTMEALRERISETETEADFLGPADSFEDHINELAKNNSPEIIHNASIKHALTLFEKLLSKAAANKDTIMIVSGNLNTSFYGRLVDQLRLCSAAGCKIELIVLNANHNLKDDPFAKIAEENGRVLSPESNSELQNYVPHFILVGSSSFRMETDHQQAKAIASFNNKTIGGILQESFTRLSNAITNQTNSLNSAIL